MELDSPQPQCCGCNNRFAKRSRSLFEDVGHSTIMAPLAWLSREGASRSASSERYRPDQYRKPGAGLSVNDLEHTACVGTRAGVQLPTKLDCPWFGVAGNRQLHREGGR